MKFLPATIVCFACSFITGCAGSDEESHYFARKALLLRQNQGMRELIATAEQGALVPPDRFLIGIDERLVQNLFRVQLPLERRLGDRFIVQLDSAQVSFQAKYGAILIDGSIYRPHRSERKVAVRVLGGLDSAAIDPERGALSFNIAIDHIELKQAGALEGLLGRGAKRFLAGKGRELLQEAIPQLEVPVLLGQNIPIPSVQEGGIKLDSLAVPLHLSVEMVMAAGGKLWVRLHAEVGKVAGAEAGLGVAVEKKRKRAPAPPSPKPLNPSSSKPARDEGGA